VYAPKRCHNGIHPLRPASTLTRDEFDRLWTTLATMLRQGVEDRRIVTVHASERAAGGVDRGSRRRVYVYKRSSVDAAAVLSVLTCVRVARTRVNTASRLTRPVMVARGRPLGQTTTSIVQSSPVPLRTLPLPG